VFISAILTSGQLQNGRSLIAEDRIDRIFRIKNSRSLISTRGGHNLLAHTTLAMKKLRFVSLFIVAVAGIFLLGWYLGQKSATKLAGEFINAQMFGNSHSEILTDQITLQQIDTGRLEEAKQSINLRLDGNILALNNQVEMTDTEIPFFALKILVQMANDTERKYGSKEQLANKVIARVAKYRTEHSWKYSGTNTVVMDAGVEAKLATILKKAIKASVN
jgi:hypothetical protein